MVEIDSVQAYCLMGPPGAGKTTQMQCLASALPYSARLSVGALLRDAAADGRLGAKQTQEINDGIFIADELFLALFSDSLFAKLRCSLDRNLETAVLLIEGMPRTEKQVCWLDDNLEYWRLILLEAPDEVLRQRLMRRRSAQQGTYRLTSSRTYVPVRECRADDRPSVIERRLRKYRQDVYHLLAAMDRQKIVVDATLPPTDVTHVIISSIARAQT